MANKMAQHYGILAASFAIGGGAFSLEMVFGIVTGAWLIIAAIFAGMAWKFKKAADAAKKEMEVAREEYNIALQEFDGAKDDVLSDCPPKYQGDTTIPTCQYV